ncbi:unnamed protein product [Amoebophrya sp. A25]|nr:unnamed protein product [Amoebophrya sp. A25]|eukprot:GSA25T00007979001.1
MSRQSSSALLVPGDEALRSEQDNLLAQDAGGGGFGETEIALIEDLCTLDDEYTECKKQMDAEINAISLNRHVLYSPIYDSRILDTRREMITQVPEDDQDRATSPRSSKLLKNSLNDHGSPSLSSTPSTSASLLSCSSSRKNGNTMNRSGTPQLPGFWLGALRNSELRSFILQHDCDALSYLTDIKAWEVRNFFTKQQGQEGPDQRRKGTDNKDGETSSATPSNSSALFLEFSFRENPYFTNTCIRKAVLVHERSPYRQEAEVVCVESSKIHWKHGKSLVKPATAEMSSPSTAVAAATSESPASTRSSRRSSRASTPSPSSRPRALGRVPRPPLFQGQEKGPLAVSPTRSNQTILAGTTRKNHFNNDERTQTSSSTSSLAPVRRGFFSLFFRTLCQPDLEEDELEKFCLLIENQSQHDPLVKLNNKKELQEQEGRSGGRSDATNGRAEGGSTTKKKTTTTTSPHHLYAHEVQRCRDDGEEERDYVVGLLNEHYEATVALQKGIVPHAIRYYLNEVDGDDEDDDSDEEDVEDDEADEGEDE